MISCKDSVFDLLYTIYLVKYGKMIAENLLNLRYVPSKARLYRCTRQTASPHSFTWQSQQS